MIPDNSTTSSPDNQGDSSPEMIGNKLIIITVILAITFSSK
jgi:hypothetical protein